MLFGHTAAVQLFIDNLTHGKPVRVRHILLKKFSIFRPKLSHRYEKNYFLSLVLEIAWEDFC